MRPCGVQHPWDLGCSWHFPGWNSSVSCWGARLYFDANSVFAMPLFLCAVLKAKENQGRQPVTWASVGTSFPLASPFLLLFFFPDSAGAWAVCLLHNRRGALPSSAPAGRHGLLFASEGSQKLGWVALTVGRESWRDCSLQPLPCDLEASWEHGTASGPQFALRARKKGGTGGTWLRRLHVGGPPSNLTGIQWLHQTALAHILSWPIGKAIKHESSGDLGAVHEDLLTFAGSHTMNVVIGLLKKENVITLH